MFERYVNFDFYKTNFNGLFPQCKFERYVNFDFYKTPEDIPAVALVFERYVNFDFYKTQVTMFMLIPCLRDM